MPYASLKQLRFMHARHPGISRRIDADIRSSGERSINSKRNISTVGKSYSMSGYATNPLVLEYEIAKRDIQRHLVLVETGYISKAKG